MSETSSAPASKTPLWSPSDERVSRSAMRTFLDTVNRAYGLELNTYDDLYTWSISHIPDFWRTIFCEAEIRRSAPFESVVENLDTMPGTKWFPGARLNFAENLLRFRDDREALVAWREDKSVQRITYRELYDEVSRLTKALKKLGVSKGDRVAGYLPNGVHAVVAMLASTSLGAIWSSGSPDFGVQGATDRFGQIEPKVLFCADGYLYNGKTFDRLGHAEEISKNIGSIKHIIVVPFVEKRADLSRLPEAVHYDDLIADEAPGDIDFVQTPADHPVYILYSSGTTGVPKCIVHGAIGVLLQHYKELHLHTDVNRDTSIFYFTTCGWMMWNWLVSSLMLGARTVLFDGSPFYPGPEILWEMAEKEKLTVFGTSAKYLSALEDSGLKPCEKFDLEPLKVICSTGSPLARKSFHYVYRDIKKDVQLSSIAGGTDIISCFMLGNPMLPVYEEELQCRGLGMKVEAFDDEGKGVIGREGELVCTAPAPSMPVFFWNDPDMKKYKAAYFDVYPGVWRHGDFVVIGENGGVVMHGRSDATLNPGGVRIGTAEIYNQLEPMSEIQDSLVIGQKWEDDERVVLFVVLAPGVEFSAELEKTIRTRIRSNASPRHVPAKIIPVEAIPYTRNGKKVEVAVRKLIHGRPVKNREALANPESLDLYVDMEALKS